MHDLLFEDQRQLDVPSLMSRAERLGLDIVEFEACLESGKFAAQVEEDLQAGIRVGVEGTPAVYVNGIPTTPTAGDGWYETLVEVVDRELERARSR